ncbi:uncharacterized protein EDB93DRAFT_644721 [Suillus bovinus]|uniref:uncharacterized protein n=1 Tax=Suillus bovinus TaxID=48563 RepID=UPI001B86FE95|nr:uncharacterized protein EDB93DRAFT_644721 [Suillus bovinus]KAG2140908.1 hypothetical protein EDB93DRAFT_644721 [Suillus bovinus]
MAFISYTYDGLHQHARDTGFVWILSKNLTCSGRAFIIFQIHLRLRSAISSMVVPEAVVLFSSLKLFTKKTCSGNLRRQKSLERNQAKPRLDLDEDDWELLYVWKSLDVVIADDTNTHQMFGAYLCCTVVLQENFVESCLWLSTEVDLILSQTYFYAALASKGFSATMKENYRVDLEIKHDKSTTDTCAMIIILHTEIEIE